VLGDVFNLLTLKKISEKYQHFYQIHILKHYNSLLYANFWVIPRRLNFICRRFGTLCLFHLHKQLGMKMEQTVFRNVGI